MAAREIHVHIHVHEEGPSQDLDRRVTRLERKVDTMAGGLDALEQELQETTSIQDGLTAILNVQAGQLRDLAAQIVELGGDDTRAQEMAAEWDQRNQQLAALLASFAQPGNGDGGGTPEPAPEPGGEDMGGEATPGEDAPLTPAVEDAIDQTGEGLVDAGSSADVPAGGTPVDAGQPGQPEGA